MSGTPKEYYLLVPIAEPTAKVYIPVDIAAARIRPVLTAEEALASRDPKRLIGIIKTLYLRKKERTDAGKKNTAVDERYFKLAEDQLHGELAFVLGEDKRNIEKIIIEYITNPTKPS